MPTTIVNLTVVALFEKNLILIVISPISILYIFTTSRQMYFMFVIFINIMFKMGPCYLVE